MTLHKSGKKGGGEKEAYVRRAKGGIRWGITSVVVNLYRGKKAASWKRRQKIGGVTSVGSSYDPRGLSNRELDLYGRQLAKGG